MRISSAILSAILFSTVALPGQDSGVTLVRNNSITTLSPTTPPMAALFDPDTGKLLGQQLTQTWQYTSHHEAVVLQGDGPLVLYQLSDPNQTLFVSRLGDAIIFASHAGHCTQVSPEELAITSSNIPLLQVEYDHAATLYGISTYQRGGVVCTDPDGVVSVGTIPQPLGTDRDVSLVFLRDTLDDPAAYIIVTRTNSQDLFNLRGGLRYNGTDPENPHFDVLDANGNTVPARASLLTTTCADVNRDYQRCLVFDPYWTAVADGLVEEMQLANLSNPDGPFLKCFCAAFGGPCLVSCAVRGGVASAALFFSGAGGLNQTLCRSVLPQGGADCPASEGSSPDCASPGTCTLNQGHGYAYCKYPATGPYTCASSSECGIPPHCEAGRCTTAPHSPIETACGSIESSVCDHPDTCDGQGNCRQNHVPRGTACDEPENECMVDKHCDVSGRCTGPPRDCNDHNACTEDYCDPVLGCFNEDYFDCDDRNQCTTDTCDPVVGCRHVAVSCNDNNVCTTDTCDSDRGCQHDFAVDCDDQNACTSDLCDHATGSCGHAPNGCTTTAFFDDFNRPDSDTIGNGWSLQGRILSNRLNFPYTAVVFRPHEGGAGGNDITMTWAYRKDSETAGEYDQVWAHRDTLTLAWTTRLPGQVNGEVLVSDGQRRASVSFYFELDTDYNFQWDIFSDYRMNVWVWRRFDPKPGNPQLVVPAFVPSLQDPYWAIGSRGAAYFDDFRVETPARSTP